MLKKLLNSITESKIAWYETLEVASRDDLLEENYKLDGVFDVYFEPKPDDMTIINCISGHSANTMVLDRVSWELLDDGETKPFQYEMTVSPDYPQETEINVIMPYVEAQKFLSNQGYCYTCCYTTGYFAKFSNGTKKALGRNVHEFYSMPQLA